VACLKDSELKEGQMKPVRVKGKPILLVRKGGQIFGLSNICPHAECSLHNGILNEYLVMCPCHGWKFDIRNGQYTESDAITLVNYKCKVQNGKICVEIIGKGSSFFNYGELETDDNKVKRVNLLITVKFARINILLSTAKTKIF